jgi:hypothetical protein
MAFVNCGFDCYQVKLCLGEIITIMIKERERERERAPTLFPNELDILGHRKLKKKGLISD